MAKTETKPKASKTAAKKTTTPKKKTEEVVNEEVILEENENTEPENENDVEVDENSNPIDNDEDYVEPTALANSGLADKQYQEMLEQEGGIDDEDEEIDENPHFDINDEDYVEPTALANSGLADKQYREMMDKLEADSGNDGLVEGMIERTMEKNDPTTSLNHHNVEVKETTERIDSKLKQKVKRRTTNMSFGIIYE